MGALQKFKNFSFLCTILCIITSHQVMGALEYDKVDQILKNVFDCHQHPAMVVSIVQGQKILFSNGYGFESADGGAPVTNKSTVAIGTLSMAFTSTLLLKLFSEILTFNLFTTMKEIYKDWKVPGSDILTDELILRDMMAQMVGLRDYTEIRMDRSMTRKNAYRRLMNLPVDEEYRYSFIQSRLVYGVLSDVAEIRGKDRYESLLQDRLLKPLTMTNTKFMTSDDLPVKGMVRGYVHSDGEWIEIPSYLYNGLKIRGPFHKEMFVCGFTVTSRDDVIFLNTICDQLRQATDVCESPQTWGKLIGADGILSTADDMAKWLLFNLNLGLNTRGERVMKRIDIEKRMFRPSNNLQTPGYIRYYTQPKVPVAFTAWAYGYGWKFGSYRGYNVLFETSTDMGFTSLALLVPDLSFGLFVSLSGSLEVNSEFLPINLFMIFFDMFLEETPWLDFPLLCTFPDPWFSVEVPIRPLYNKSLSLILPAEFYVGSFSHSAFGTIEIRYNSTSDGVYALYGGEKWLLHSTTSEIIFWFEITGDFGIIMDKGEINFYIDSNKNESVSLELRTRKGSLEFLAVNNSSASTYLSSAFLSFVVTVFLCLITIE